MSEVKLTVKDITEGNRREKYLTAVNSLAKAMQVPVTLKRRDDERAERYPYRSYANLVDKWTLYYARLLEQIYKTVCSVFDLPFVSTFSKAMDSDPLIYKGKILYSPESGKPITQKQWRDFVRVMERFLNRGMQEPEKRIVLDSVALGRVLDRMLKYNSWEAVESMRLADIEYRNHKFEWLSDELNLSRAFGMTDFQASRIQVAKDSAAQYVRAMDDKSRTTINQVILNGIKERSSKSEVAQDLFDRMGDLNRDWQRIVETEVGDNMNSAFLLAQRENAKPGEKVYFQRFEMFDQATCKHCDKIRGLVALWSDVALADEKIDDKFASVAIWDGKTRVGRKAADPWVAEGVQHPWCYSDDTEVMTNHGWKPFPSLKGDDLIMSINPATKEVGFVRYVNRIAYSRDGKMIRFHGRNYDLLVTPDHNMIFRTQKNTALREASAVSLLDRRSRYMLPRAVGMWYGKEIPQFVVSDLVIPAKEYVKLWAWFLAEGSGRIRGKNGNEVKIAQKYPEKIVADLPTMNQVLHKYDDSVCLYGEYAKIFREFFQIGAENKYIPDFIKELSTELIRTFLDTYSRADGTKYVNVKNHPLSYSSTRSEMVVRTSSRRMADDLCELIVKAGWLPSINVKRQKGKVTRFKNGEYELRTDCYNITICKSAYRSFSVGGTGKSGKASLHPYIVDYHGMVYDVELEKWHFLLVKRNGKTAWSGNCRGSWARWYAPAAGTGGMYDAAMAKLKGKQRAWGEAVFKAEAEFRAKGIDKPNDTTPGYMDRINELYRSA